MSFDISELSPETQRVVFGGRLDAPAVGGMELVLTAKIKSAARNTVFDLSAVDFVSSLGIRMLFGLARVIARQGRKAVLVGIQPPVMEIFDTVAMGQVIPLASDDAEALAMVGA
jgi:anti-anti-sigma factor